MAAANFPPTQFSFQTFNANGDIPLVARAVDQAPLSVNIVQAVGGAEKQLTLAAGQWFLSGQCSVSFAAPVTESVLMYLALVDANTGNNISSSTITCMGQKNAGQIVNINVNVSDNANIPNANAPYRVALRVFYTGLVGGGATVIGGAFYAQRTAELPSPFTLI